MFLKEKIHLTLTIFIGISLLIPSHVFAVTWEQLTDPTPNGDFVSSVAADADSVYIAGYQGMGTNSVWGPSMWRIEKRDQQTGALVSEFGSGGVLVYNPTDYKDYVIDISASEAGLFVIGKVDENVTFGTPGAREGQVILQKMDPVTGAVAWTKTITLGFNGNSIYADETAVYVTGNIGNREKIEKRSVSDGNLVSGFGAGGVMTGSDTYFINEITGDDSFIYYTSAVFAGGNSWQIEKARKDTGEVIWTQTMVGPTQYVSAGGIAVHSDGVYVAVLLRTGGTYLRYEYAVEKRRLDTGAVVWRHESQNAGDESLNGIAVNDSGVYVSGFNGYVPESAPARFYVEKRDRGTGNLIPSFGTNGAISRSLTDRYIGYESVDIVAGRCGVFPVGGMQFFSYFFYPGDPGPGWFSANVDPVDCPTPGAFLDIGLRIQQGTPAAPDIQSIAAEDPAGTPTSPLRIVKEGIIYSIALVDPADPNATKLRIRLGDGSIKALRACRADNGCAVRP